MYGTDGCPHIFIICYRQDGTCTCTSTGTRCNPPPTTEDCHIKTQIDKPRPRDSLTQLGGYTEVRSGQSVASPVTCLWDFPGCGAGANATRAEPFLRQGPCPHAEASTPCSMPLCSSRVSSLHLCHTPSCLCCSLMLARVFLALLA